MKVNWEAQKTIERRVGERRTRNRLSLYREKVGISMELGSHISRETPERVKSIDVREVPETGLVPMKDLEG